MIPPLLHAAGSITHAINWASSGARRTQRDQGRSKEAKRGQTASAWVRRGELLRWTATEAGIDGQARSDGSDGIGQGRDRLLSS